MTILRVLALLSISAGASSAADTQFSTFLGGKWGEYASAVTTDRAGNIYVTGETGSPDFPVTAGAAQTTFGGGSDVFIAKLSPEGALIWCTFFGGSGGEGARGIAVDDAGNVTVAGMTGSLDLPVVNALQTTLDNGHLRYGADAFVAKVDATGSRFLYATYLGGDGNDWAWALAMDAAGNAYVTGESGPVEYFPGPNGKPLNAPGFYVQAFIVKLDPAGAIVYATFIDDAAPRAIAVDSAGSVYLTGTAGKPGASELGSHVFVAKLTPDGSGVVYKTMFGGTAYDVASAIALDAAGAAYLTGMTNSSDFPSVNALQPSFGARTVWKSTDGTATWSPVDDAPFGAVSALVVDPQSNALFAATDRGVYRSGDGGANWQPANQGLAGERVQALAVEGTGVLYVGTLHGVFRSRDGGTSWTQAVNGLPFQSVALLAVDAGHPGTVYVSDSNGKAAKTTDGGDSWNALGNIPGNCGCLTTLAVDPNPGGAIYAAGLAFSIKGVGGGGGVFRSADGGATWAKIPGLIAATPNLVVDNSTTPSTIYAGALQLSLDGGVTWNPLKGFGGGLASVTALSLAAGGSIYAATIYPEIGLLVSDDRGATWRPAPGAPFNGIAYTVPQILSLVNDPANPGTVYAVASNTQSAAFVSKLGPDGALVYSTFLRGHPIVDGAQTGGGGNITANLYYAPGQNYGEAIALDADGNMVVAGATRTKDFPLQGAMQSSSANFLDTWLTVLRPDGAEILFSTYLGGGLNDSPRALAVDSQGAIVLVGQTYSDDFPVKNAVQSVKQNYDDVFVIKLKR